MEVILLEKIRRLGNLGQKVKVKPGFGRNFLVPQGKAVAATTENLAVFEKKRAEYEKREAEMLSAAQKRADALNSLVLDLPAKVGDEGKLYGSIGVREVAMAITNAGIEVAKSEVRLPQGVIRYVGEYEVGMQLHSDVFAAVKINVVAEV